MSEAIHRKTPTPDIVAILPSGGTSFDAGPLIEELCSSAASRLSSVLGASPLVGFQTGALGNFPYSWQNPSNLEFNHLTYQWINSNLKADTTPATQDDQLFTNLFIEVLSKVNYSLSSTDKVALNQAQQNATIQQATLLNAWKQAFGSIPVATATQQPIDIIMSTIANQWAMPPTSLVGIRNAKNLNNLLNNTPASGEPILPVLAAYLDAIGSSISLQNASTMNNAYLGLALSALQSPTTANGGLTTDDGSIQPAYAVATQLSDILNGLNNTSNHVTVTMSVVRSSESEYTVSIINGATFSIPIGDFFVLDVGGSGNYFSDSIATSLNTVTLTATFPGVTLVNFGPVPFNLSTQQSWYWMSPITQAIANGSSDVSGFKFQPQPGIDFSTTGPFGFIQGVAISKYPSVQIVVTSSLFESIAQTIKTQVDTSLTFLGIPLASASSSTYSHNASIDAAGQTVTITLSPPLEADAGTQVQSVGWVLGVQTNYPAAT